MSGQVWRFGRSVNVSLGADCLDKHTRLLRNIACTSKGFNINSKQLLLHMPVNAVVDPYAYSTSTGGFVSLASVRPWTKTNKSIACIESVP